MKIVERITNEENLKRAKSFAKRSCQVIVPILGVVLSSISVKDLLDAIRYTGDVGYGDAVDVIMSSSMYSSDKTRMVSALKRDESSDYYKAVIAVVRSSGYSSDKLRTIQNMSETE